MKPEIYLACYRGRREGSGFKVWTARLSDWLIRKATRGVYSHCEIAVLSDSLPANRRDCTAQFECYSSSIRDGGVRCKTMQLPAEKWDLIELPENLTYRQLRAFYLKTRGAGYDFAGALGVVLKTRQNRRRWFCSEWCAAALGLPEPHRFSPQSLAEKLRGNQ